MTDDIKPHKSWDGARHKYLWQAIKRNIFLAATDGDPELAGYVLGEGGEWRKRERSE